MREDRCGMDLGIGTVVVGREGGEGAMLVAGTKEEWLSEEGMEEKWVRVATVWWD